ncbi:MAG: dihydrofolate synthase/folylpolyglutamate synthase [Saprospiraceae bacterium]|jgi:dihydrofolate synthase/folylpolyglutamate synthase|tara:strand:+ start:326 stop:1630 length:1305 start_codon:yes stop_codon:yes gene_type:complete
MSQTLSFDQAGDWLAWLEQQHPSHEIDMGLARIRQVSKRLLKDAPIAKQVITVAGTNGKGSSVAFLTSILEQAGLAYASLTSPHFVRFNERIQFQGEPVDDVALCASFERVNQARYDAVGRATVLTYFEFNALLAFDLMQRADLDVAVLEIGLGGRLDAVNLIDADIAIVTSIAVDHVDWLGDNVELIGREKAGIYRANKPAIVGAIDGPASVAQYAHEINALCLQNGIDFKVEGQMWSNPSGLTIELPKTELPPMNMAAVVQAIQCLSFDIKSADIRLGLDRARLQGRFQRLEWQGKQLILDVAHNPQAAQNLANSLATEACEGRTIAVLAMLADKDYQQVITVLRASFNHWMLASSEGVRSLSSLELADQVASHGIDATCVTTHETPLQAFNEAVAMASDKDRIIVFGSFITVGAVLALIESSADEPMKEAN